VRCGDIFCGQWSNIGSDLRAVCCRQLRRVGGLIVLCSLQPRCVLSFDRSKLVDHLLSVRIRYVLGSVWSIVVLAVRYWDLFYRDWSNVIEHLLTVRIWHLLRFDRSHVTEHLLSVRIRYVLGSVWSIVVLAVRYWDLFYPDWSDLVEHLLAVRQRKRLCCFGSHVIEHLLAMHARNVLGRRCSIVVHRVFGRQLRRVGGLIVLQSLRCGVIFCSLIKHLLVLPARKVLGRHCSIVVLVV
jgi:hypothetical protein